MFYQFIRLILFKLQPEKTHLLVLNTLNILKKLFLLQFFFRVPKCPIQVMDLNFVNPVGLAAGLDKNGDYFASLSSLGFGFVEIGTVTPRKQPGNPKPRLFRYPQFSALVNRMGFNNNGVDALVTKLKESKYKGILGISISKNNHTSDEQAIEDYIECLQKVYRYASYIVFNISCPNVKKVHHLSFETYLIILLENLTVERNTLAETYQKKVPLFVKVSPDLSTMDLEIFTRLVLRYKIDGVIATNTTLQRDQVLPTNQCIETGGLSGEPLFQLSLKCVQKLRTMLGPEITIIASGGIMSAQHAHAMFEAGANLIQLYTGLIYHGPKLIKEIVKTYLKHKSSFEC